MDWRLCPESSNGDSAILIRNFEDALSGYLSAASEGKFADIPNTDQYSLRIQTTPGLVEPILRLEKAANALKNWQNRDRARALISRDVWNYNLTNATAAQRAANWKDSDLRPYTPTKADLIGWDRDARQDALDKEVIEHGWHRANPAQGIAMGAGVVVGGGLIGWFLGWLLTFLSFLILQFSLDRLRDFTTAWRGR